MNQVTYVFKCLCTRDTDTGAQYFHVIKPACAWFVEITFVQESVCVFFGSGRDLLPKKTVLAIHNFTIKSVLT